jgi:hypothetical protein
MSEDAEGGVRCRLQVGVSRSVGLVVVPSDRQLQRALSEGTEACCTAVAYFKIPIKHRRTRVSESGTAPVLIAIHPDRGQVVPCVQIRISDYSTTVSVPPRVTTITTVTTTQVPVLSSHLLHCYDAIIFLLYFSLVIIFFSLCFITSSSIFPMSCLPPTTYYCSSYPSLHFILPSSPYNFSYFLSFLHHFHFSLFPSLFPDQILAPPLSACSPHSSTSFHTTS